MNKSATVLLGLALTGILVVATMQGDTKEPQAEPKRASEKKSKTEPKKVVL